MSEEREPSQPAQAPPVHDGATDADKPATSPTEPWPPWAKGFPDDPTLRRLVQAFELGRYDVVRAEAPRLADTTDNPKVAEAARELRRRLDVDPMAIKLLLGAFALLALLTAWAYSHNHP